MLKQISLATLLVAATFTLPAFAAGKSHGGGSGPPPWAGGPSGNPSGGSNKGAPGPIAGAGLPFLLLAGGYVLMRRYRNRGRAQ
jgi:hypothetical protein